MNSTRIKQGIALTGGICLALSIGLNVYQYRQSIKPVQTVESDKFVIHKTGWKEWEIYLKDDSQKLVPQQGKGARGVELFGYDK